MKKCFSILLFLFSVFAVAGVYGTAEARVDRITDNANDSTNPRTNNNGDVVWSELVNGNYEIFVKWSYSSTLT